MHNDAQTEHVLYARYSIRDSHDLVRMHRDNVQLAEKWRVRAYSREFDQLDCVITAQSYEFRARIISRVLFARGHRYHITKGWLR